MEKKETSRGQKLLVMVGIISLSAIIACIVLPILSMLTFSTINLFLSKKLDPAISIAVSFMWIPMIGLICGTALGTVIVFLRKKK
ncbi:MAG TPA: hypothetical protein VI976_02400 [Candidatus Omnitrophota bacterium]|nr:hypothetical protein [Candidatus Omnitrophota bacterium]